MRNASSSDRLHLTIEIDRDDEGRWVAEVLELGCLVHADTRDGALRSGRALALSVLADKVEQGEMDHTWSAVEFEETTAQG